ncbi:MAG: LLM class flavin-dependent oxidoreductase [Acidimicrobiia bacterium]
MTSRPRLTIGFDMRAPQWGTPAPALYKAAIEQVTWADRLGFETCTVNEHHNTIDGYIPSPRVLAAGMATVTQNIRLNISALLVTLHHPIAVAEDLAVLDNLSNGRISAVIGAGYRKEEFLVFGTNWKRRPSLVIEAIETMRKAWTGEPFEFRGTTVTVLPKPARPGGPPLALAGASEGAARRAAQLAMPFVPVGRRWYDIYLEELGKLGAPIPDHPYFRFEEPQAHPHSFLHIANDPDAAWARIAPHALHHVNTYASWAQRKDLTPFKAMDNADGLRGNGYLVVTPDECVKMAEEIGPNGRLHFFPLLGGLDPDVAWESLTLFEQKVLPRLGQG